MFNAEKLLGKVLQDVIGSGAGRSSSLLGGLSSGGGLMTMLGLGVGAMEILKDRQQQAPAWENRAQACPPPPPPPLHPSSPPPQPSDAPVSAPYPNWGGPVQAPSQPPPQPPAGMPAVAAPPPEAAPVPPAEANTEELAIRLIRVMIAAAHADGTLDAAEEQAILERANKAGLSREERLFFLDELQRPKSIAELTAGISDPSVARTMYLLAVSTIVIDTEAERNWLDQLAAALGLSKAVQTFLEEQE